MNDGDPAFTIRTALEGAVLINLAGMIGMAWRGDSIGAAVFAFGFVAAIYFLLRIIKRAR